mgnify:FL=1
MADFDGQALAYEAAVAADATLAYGGDPLFPDEVDAITAPFREQVAEERAILNAELGMIGTPKPMRKKHLR